MSLTWEAARAGGLVAWGLSTASVTWGLALSTRLLRRRPWPSWLLDLHRFLGALAVVFTLVHVLAVLVDGATDFGVADILVPFSASWHPVAVAWGIVAFYLLLAVELTSLARRWIGRTWWRRVHLASFGVFGLGTIHALTAGTDTTSRLVFAAIVAGSMPLLALAALRLDGLAQPSRSR